MKRKWYRIDDSLDVTPGRWHLDCPIDSLGNEIEPRIFAEGRPVNCMGHSSLCAANDCYQAEYAGEVIEWTGELVIPLQYEGNPLDITFGAFDMLVMRPAVVDLLQSIAPGDFQRFPARVEGQSGTYEIVNAIRLIDCVDGVRTKAYQQWAYENPATDIPGKYSRIGKLSLFLFTENLQRIDTNINIWRIYDHESCLIGSEMVKRRLEENRITGVEFQEVS